MNSSLRSHHSQKTKEFELSEAFFSSDSNTIGCPPSSLIPTIFPKINLSDKIRDVFSKDRSFSISSNFSSDENNSSNAGFYLFYS